jgi:hypothetical protein
MQVSRVLRGSIVRLREVLGAEDDTPGLPRAA